VEARVEPTSGSDWRRAATIVAAHVAALASFSPLVGLSAASWPAAGTELTDPVRPPDEFLPAPAETDEDYLFATPFVASADADAPPPGSGPPWRHGSDFWFRKTIHEVVPTEGGPPVKRSYIEYLQGNNRWTVRQGIVPEADAKGPPTELRLRAADGRNLAVQVHGGATPEELAALRNVLEAAPPASWRYASRLYLTSDLGSITDLGGNNQKRVHGLADGLGRISIDRGALLNSRADRILYHEMGHVMDTTWDITSSPGPVGWGNGDSVSQYGRRNASEDYAETHRVVLQDWNRLVKLSPLEWALEPQARKKADVLRRYATQSSK
jgi:hypothetical protein